MSSVSKAAVLAAIRTQLQRERDGLAAATRLARDEAAHAESRPENEYDTRALEASYLAAGQGERLEELETLLAWFGNLDPARRMRTVMPGALVTVEDDAGRQTVLLVAPSGGTRVTVDGTAVQVISPKATLGRALSGLAADDAVEVELGGELREVTVLSIS